MLLTQRSPVNCTPAKTMSPSAWSGSGAILNLIELVYRSTKPNSLGKTLPLEALFLVRIQAG